jgi:hypothetical protein
MFSCSNEGSFGGVGDPMVLGGELWLAMFGCKNKVKVLFIDSLKLTKLQHRQSNDE